jgi:hypothetical protein
MATPELHDDLEGHAANESDRYGILPGIVGVLLGLAVIVFMFAVADGFH